MRDAKGKCRWRRGRRRWHVSRLVSLTGRRHSVRLVTLILIVVLRRPLTRKAGRRGRGRESRRRIALLLVALVMLSPAGRWRRRLRQGRRAAHVLIVPLLPLPVPMLRLLQRVARRPWRRWRAALP